MDYATLEMYAGYDDIESFKVWCMLWDYYWDATD